MSNRIFATLAFTIGLSFSSGLQAQTYSTHANNYWFTADYLYWKIQNSPKLVPLVVQGPVVPNGSPVLGQPDTSVVLGGKEINYQWQSGGSFSLGHWLCDQHTLGVEANYFFIPNNSHKHSVFSNGLAGSPYFSVPFIDAVTGQETSETIAAPGFFSGAASFKISYGLQGAELIAIRIYPYSNNVNFGVSGGLQFLDFYEKLSFDTSSPNVPPAPTDTYLTHEKFNVTNNFFGAQIGVNADYITNQFSFNAMGKIGLGAMFQKSEIDGYLLTNDFNGLGNPVRYPGGYFAQPSSMGTHKHTVFSVIPEIKLNAAYQLTNNFKLQAGYTFMYVSNVLRASKQMSRTINPTQSSALEFIPNPVLEGPALPTGSLKSEGLWAQGFNVGVEYSI